MIQLAHHLGGQNVRDEELFVWQRKPAREQKEETKQSRWGFRGKTFWDWLPIVGALLIPVVIALGTWAITWQQGKIEDQRAKVERELAEQRAQDEALQAYLDYMGQLILNRKLPKAEQGDPVHTLAQARTSTIILRLDAEHNESVTRFLSSSGLAVSSEGSARLLGNTTLSHATLSDAYLRSAYLPNADLSDADLSGADMNSARGITGEELERQATSLEGATMPNGQKYEDWLKDRVKRQRDE